MEVILEYISSVDGILLSQVDGLVAECSDVELIGLGSFLVWWYEFELLVDSSMRLAGHDQNLIAGNSVLHLQASSRSTKREDHDSVALLSKVELLVVRTLVCPESDLVSLLVQIEAHVFAHGAHNFVSLVGVGVEEDFFVSLDWFEPGFPPQISIPVVVLLGSSLLVLAS